MYRNILVVTSTLILAFILSTTPEISSAQDQNIRESLKTQLFDSGFWFNASRSGVVIASRYNYYDDAHYEQLIRRAEAELYASFFTSVHVVWFQANSIPMSEWSEFSTIQDGPLSYTTADSLYVGSTLVYRIVEKTHSEAEQHHDKQNIYNFDETVNTSVDCERPRFDDIGKGDNIVETNSCWHVRQKIQYSEFDAHPALVNAKNEALAQLAQYLKIRVQQMDRFTHRGSNNPVRHFESKVGFQQSQVSRLIINEQELTVFISVPKDGIIEL